MTMNILERQVNFGRTLFEINQNTFQELAQGTQQNIVKYFELNSEFSQRLPEVRDVTSFMDLQREYGETLLGSVREATRSRAEILKSAVEETGNAVRKVFASD
jgi:Phasin protein